MFAVYFMLLSFPILSLCYALYSHIQNQYPHPRRYPVADRTIVIHPKNTILTKHAFVQNLVADRTTITHPKNTIITKITLLYKHNQLPTPLQRQISRARSHCNRNLPIRHDPILPSNAPITQILSRQIHFHCRRLGGIDFCFLEAS